MTTPCRFKKSLLPRVLCAGLVIALVCEATACKSGEPRPVPPSSFVGAEVSDVSQETVNSSKLPSSAGALVVRVQGGQAAEEAGLKAGDVLVRWNGEAIPDAATLQWMVLSSPSGAKAEVVFIRDGKENSTSLTIREKTAGAGGSRTQSEVERDFLAAMARVDRKESTPAEAFGDIERWTLTIGPRILLDPLSRQWLYYDKFHEAWEPTGYGIGEANFGLFKGKLAAKRLSGGAPRK